MPTTTTAVEAAKARRSAAAAKATIQEREFIANVMKRIDLTLEQRALLFVNFLRDKMVKNLSISVKVAKGPPVLIQRSKPGEFPRADTTTLMKSIFGEVRKLGGGSYNCYVGTPVWYGVRLELKMNRSFLRRTLREEIGSLKAIMGGTIK